MDENSTLNIFCDFANNDENIRGVLLEGSRAFGMIDRYSDFDIVFVTKSNEPYFDENIIHFLNSKFGAITIMQTPDNGDPHDVYTHLIQFESGVRIDLTFNSFDFWERINPESATKVILDKDHRFSQLPTPSDADFWVKKPTEQEFHEHYNELKYVSDKMHLFMNKYHEIAHLVAAELNYEYDSNYLKNLLTFMNKNYAL